MDVKGLLIQVAELPRRPLDGRFGGAVVLLNNRLDNKGPLRKGQPEVLGKC